MNRDEHLAWYKQRAMRALLIDDRAKAEAKRVLDFALQQPNWYRPSAVPDSVIHIPGDDKRHITRLSPFRCVFSITVDSQGKPWRDLSISVPSKDYYPDPAAAFTIAQLFGFTGWGALLTPPPSDLVVKTIEEEHCVRIAQPFMEEKNAQS